MSHIPVMLPEILQNLAPAAGKTYLDGTFGGGGYARAILEHADCTLWAIDRDPEAIARGAALAAAFPARLHLIEGSFGNMLDLLHEAGITSLDGVVLDLGLSSFQLDDFARGFSFRGDGPLDMRMSRSGPSAADLVADLSEADLAEFVERIGAHVPPNRPRHRRRPCRVAHHHHRPPRRNHPQCDAADTRRHSPRHTQLPGAPHPGE
jgi:16S rRNA (cytosine1402-N4)-methyltransferase